MQANKDVLWVEKYRPKVREDYVFHDDNLKDSVDQYVEDGIIPHLLFSGVQGTGKTSLAQIIINELKIDPIDVLTLNASDKNSVDVMRNNIQNFISTYPVGKFKIVHLEEADYLTLQGQAVLRRLMEEEYANTSRFIMTCNYENKLIPAIRSRCESFRFVASNRDDIVEQMATILLNERVKFGIDLLDDYISIGYPDIRKIINLLHQNTINGTLRPISTTADTGDYKLSLLPALSVDDWKRARELVCGNVAPEEWEELYRFLYDNLHKSPKYSDQNKWDAGIVIIADHLSKHTLCADAEINSAAMFIRLSQI